MDTETHKALQVETEFLAGVEHNLRQARGRQLRGAIWDLARLDEGVALRTALAERRLFDRELLARMPQGRRIVLRGFERPWWWFGKRQTSVTIASVLVPPAEFLPDRGETATRAPAPVGLSELLSHVRKIAPDPKTPHLVAVCSPSGFVDEVKRSHLDLPNVTLLVVEPRDAGGWSVTALGEGASEAMCALFNPETTAKRIARVREEIDERSADLLTGGLSAEDMAERLGLSPAVVAEAFRQAALTDPELRVSRAGSNAILFRGAATEDDDMSMGDWIRQLFGGSGNEAKKINVLSERRARLAQRRDRLYEDIAKLEHRERDLLEQGRQNKSPAVRQRVASQLAQHRRDMGRLNTTASMLSQQINVISTHIHNLTLIQQGQMARLPASEELANDAVRAEEMLEQLKSETDLVSTLESGVNEVLVSQEELDILKEFDEPAAAAEPGEAAPESLPAEPEPQRRDDERTRREPEAN